MYPTNRCSPQCLRAAQSRLGKKLIEIRNEPTLQGGIFLRHLLLRNPKVGDLYPDVVLSIITSFIEMTLNTSDMTSRRLCIDLYSIRYGCDAQMMEILLNTLSASIMNKLLSQEERTGILNLKSLGVPAMRVHLCNLLFEMFSSSLSFAKAGQFVVRDAIMNILEISLNDLELRDAALGTIRSLCTNGKNSFLPLVPQVVTILISKLKVPSDSLFQTLHHMCQIYGPSSTVFRHLYVTFSSLVHPLDEKDYGISAGRLLSTVIQTSAHFVKPEVLLTIQRKICEEVLRNINSPIYQDILISFLSCTHELIPPPIYIARTVIKQSSVANNVQSLNTLCDVLTRPRIQTLARYEIFRRSLEKMERGIDDRVDSDIDESTAFSTSAIKASDEQTSQHTYEPIEEDSVAEQSPVMNEMAPGKQNVLSKPSASTKFEFSKATSNVCDGNSNVMADELPVLKSKDIDMETDNIPSTSKCYDEPVAEIKESERGQHQETFEEVELMDGEASVDEILSTFYPD